MPHPAVGIPNDKRRVGDDDPRRPARSQRHKNPQPKSLQDGKQDEPTHAHVCIITEDDQAKQPATVQGDDQRIMPRRDLARAMRQQPGDVAPRPHSSHGLLTLAEAYDTRNQYLMPPPDIKPMPELTSAENGSKMQEHLSPFHLLSN